MTIFISYLDTLVYETDFTSKEPTGTIQFPLKNRLKS